MKSKLVALLLALSFSVETFAQHYDDFSSDFMFGSSGNDEELPEDDSANDLMNEAIPLEISDIAFVLMGVSLIAISAIYSKSRKKLK